MKILFYADTVFGVGGVQRVLALVAQHLSLRHEVTILTTELWDADDRYDYDATDVRFESITYPDRHGWEYLRCKAVSLCYKRGMMYLPFASRLYSCSFFRPSYKRNLVEAINRGGYDVVVGVHAFFSLHLASVRRRLKVPVVIGWMHNSFSALFTMDHPYLPDLFRFFRWRMRALDHLVVLTHADARLFESQMGLACQVIYNPLALTPRGCASLDHHRFVALGRFSPRHKGFDLLLQAFEQFAPKHPEWQLLLVGEGSEEAAYRDFIRCHHLEKRVTIAPFTNRVQEVYASGSYYVLSSRWEGLPLVLFEAMAHGLPVVASDIPVARELMESKELCDFFRCGDANDLARALSTAARRTDWKQRSDRAIQESQRYTLADICGQWEELFQPPSGRVSILARIAGWFSKKQTTIE